MSKTKVIDYRTDFMDTPPPGMYYLKIVEYLHDGRPLLKITEGPYAGVILIGQIPGPQEVELVH